MLKKNILILGIAVIAIAAFPGQAAPSKTLGPAESNTTSARAAHLIERLEQLNALDKATMSSIERRSARKEVKSINNELKRLDGGIYLSVGAAVIIILLLIVLL